jgi:AraC-like DNA-binding protein
MAIHVGPNVLRFESESQKQLERADHNARGMATVRRTKRPLSAPHAGFWDYFVPLVLRDSVEGVLVVGPIAHEQATTGAVRERWHWLTSEHAYLDDPKFAAYLAASLETLVLDGARAEKFQRMLVCFASLMVGSGRADRLANELETLAAEVVKSRDAERTWDAVREMIDPRSTETWRSSGSAADLRRLGLQKPADHVLVSLIVDRGTTHDAVDAAIRRHGFQRRAVELARSIGRCACGRVGDQGVVFLSALHGSAARRRQKALDLVERASTLAQKEFGLDLHSGAADLPRSLKLSDAYQSAQSAAVAALTHRTALELAGKQRPTPLWKLGRDLGRALEEQPAAILARFDRYLQAVSAGVGHRVDLMRIHLDVGFERIAEVLAARAELDPKSHTSLREALDTRAAGVRTAAELSAVYRGAVAEMCAGLERPVPARRERNLRHALDFIRAHYAEPITRDQAARLAGFTPTYFSVLFKRHAGKSFEHYLRDLRLSRAKQLLSQAEPNVTRVAELSGFRSIHYFSRVFRAHVGMRPLAFRRRASEDTRWPATPPYQHKRTKSQKRGPRPG